MSTRKGFTLVELLVVVAIIALLVSILLPALGQARYQTKLVLCATRQRTILQAINSYSSEYGKLPPTNQCCWENARKTDIWYTIPNRVKYKYGSSFEMNGGSVIKTLGEYMESAANFTCPAITGDAKWEENFIKNSNDDGIPLLDSSFFMLWNWMKYENDGFRPTDNSDTLMVMDMMMITDQYNCISSPGDSWMTSHTVKGGTIKLFEGLSSLYPEDERIKICRVPNRDNTPPDININAGYVDGHVEQINAADDMSQMITRDGSPKGYFFPKGSFRQQK